MTTTVSAPAPEVAIRRTPWHLWVVGVLSLLWNAFGAFDYTMSHTQGDAHFRKAGMTDAQIAAFHAIPPWMELFWAMGVWGAVIGSVLLLLRSRWAVPVLLASLVGAAVSLLHASLLAREPRLDRSRSRSPSSPRSWPGMPTRCANAAC